MEVIDFDHRIPSKNQR